jgi:hypothetical protein
MPPKTALDQARHLSLFLIKAVLNGRADYTALALSRFKDF